MNKTPHTYGTAVHASELYQLIDHLMEVNTKAEAAGRPKTPLCIWGQHGLGKTELVEGYARSKGYRWAYVAPAQFEEMGDLLGMPQIQGEQTHFAPPEWVPLEEGPGILLIDDFNRADGRILNGIMQLLQRYELHSWKLPPQWHILLTANPDQGDYSVTPLDEALLTRMMHVTMIFNAAEWARWAASRQLDERAIAFVLSHPQLASGHRSSPRTLVQFFDAIAGIEDWRQQKGLIQMLGDACLDSDTVAAFLDYIDKGMGRLPSTEIILNTSNFEEEVFRPLQKITASSVLRSDLLSAICTMLGQHLHAEAPTPHQLDNLKSFIKIDFLPSDLRLLLAQDLMATPHPSIKALFADPEVGSLLIG